MSTGFDFLDPTAFDSFGAILTSGGLDFAARRATSGGDPSILLAFLAGRFTRLSSVEVGALTDAAVAGVAVAKGLSPVTILAEAVGPIRASLVTATGTTVLSRRAKTGFTVTFPDIGKKVFVNVTGEGFETAADVIKEAERLARQLIDQYPDKFGLKTDETVGVPKVDIEYIIPAIQEGLDDVI